MKIAFVIGDIGSTKELVPAARELERGGHNITWIADKNGNGKGKDLLAKEGIPFASQDDFGDYDVIVIGTSATAVDGQIAWTRYGKEANVLVIWYEDLWATGQRPVTRCVDPDVMLTISETASVIVKHVRPDIQVEVVGKPSFEEINYFHSRIDESRGRVREELEVEDNDIVVLYWGGGERDRVKIHLEALMGIEEVSSRRVILLPRLHPKMPGRRDLWSSLRVCSNVVDVHSVDEVALNCAADVVMGEFGSTQTYVAAIVGTHPLIALWPDNLEGREACGFVNGVPPLIENGVATDVRSRQDIERDICWWIRNGNCQDLRRKALHVFGDAIRPGGS